LIIYRPHPLYPLPKDYAGLSAEGQYQARMSVLCDHSTPHKLVLAWDLFRRLYLAQTREAIFYKDGFLESPDFHSEMVYALGSYALNAWGAPRGSAKSTVLDLEITLLLALTRPGFDISLFFSTDKMKQPRFDTLMDQLTRNELILSDFGTMKPIRGSATWNHEYLQFSNGSTISGGSVMGKMRGGRPRLLILDDPENDPENQSETSRLVLIERFEVILFKKMLPMLKPGSCMFWIGTLIDRRAFLYRAIEGDDPRFDFWNRVNLRAIAYDEEDETKCHLIWPEMWSQEYLESERKRIGPSAFASEFCNDPISAQDRILLVDPRKNEYTVEGEFNWSAPLTNTNIVKWNERIFGEDNDHRTYKEMERKYNELVGPMFKVLLFDYASGLTSYHDYSCIEVCGFDTLGTMWLLYGWLGRAKDDTLMRMIYETGLIWQVRVLGIEAVSIQKAFAEAAQEYINEQTDMRGDKWRGRVFPVTYPSKESKAQRISSALEWRFNSGRVKLPAHLQEQWPYNQVYAQAMDFTMDLALLQHDDALDTLAMHKYVIKTKGSKFRREQGKPGLKERIIKNLPEIEGMPVLSGVASAEITDEMMNIMSQQRRKRNIQPPQRRIERLRPKIIR